MNLDITLSVGIVRCYIRFTTGCQIHLLSQNFAQSKKMLEFPNSQFKIS